MYRFMKTGVSSRAEEMATEGVAKENIAMDIKMEAIETASTHLPKYGLCAFFTLLLLNLLLSSFSYCHSDVKTSTECLPASTVGGDDSREIEGLE